MFCLLHYRNATDDCYLIALMVKETGRNPSLNFMQRGIERIERTISLAGNLKDGLVARAIGQRSLPFERKILETQEPEGVIRWIKEMDVRGAGAIGTAAAIGAILILANRRFDLIDKLREARPTAHNLKYAVDRVLARWERSNHSLEAAIEEAEAIGQEDIESCRKIGKHGMHLVAGKNQLTICNAGELAFTGWPGSALAPAYTAFELDLDVHVFVPETRPRGQGFSLTAEELKRHEVPITLLPDFAIGTMMKKGEIDVVIVGADRVARNGDTANKLGTYVVFVLAHELGIPTFIAVPTSTIDLACPDGTHIPIEDRDEEEVHYRSGWDERRRRLTTVRVTPYGTKARNPSFDVTPAEYITGFITEKGIFPPHEVWRAKTDGPHHLL